MTGAPGERELWERDSGLHGPEFVEPDSPPRLVIFGAVPLAAALCKVARAAGEPVPRARLYFMT